nr:hypothetical protein [Ardenticatenales bacterium]
MLLVLSASGYAFLPIFAKWAYAAGLKPIDLVTWRFIFAAPLIWLLILLRRTPLASALHYGRLLASGALFALVALSAFLTLERLPSSTYTLLLYTYPALV